MRAAAFSAPPPRPILPVDEAVALLGGGPKPGLRDAALAALLAEVRANEVLVRPAKRVLRLPGARFDVAVQPDRIGVRSRAVFEFVPPSPGSPLEGPDAGTYARLQLAMRAYGLREARVVAARALRAGMPATTAILTPDEAWFRWAEERLSNSTPPGASRS